MYETRSKRIYCQFQFINSDRGNTVCKQIEAQVWNTLQSIYKVWYKRVYFKYPSIGEWRPDRMLKTVVHSVTTIYMVFIPIYVSLTTNTWIFEVNSLTPYFIHTLECVPHLCLNLFYIIHIKWVRICLQTVLPLSELINWNWQQILLDLVSYI